MRLALALFAMCFLKINDAKSRRRWMFEPENIKSFLLTDYFVSERALNVSFHSKQNSLCIFLDLHYFLFT